MSNMSHCRFENTLIDLRDCQEHLFDDDISKEEDVKKKKLVALCQEIAEMED